MHPNHPHKPKRLKDPAETLDPRRAAAIDASPSVHPRATAPRRVDPFNWSHTRPPQLVGIINQLLRARNSNRSRPNFRPRRSSRATVRPATANATAIFADAELLRCAPTGWSTRPVLGLVRVNFGGGSRAIWALSDSCAMRKSHDQQVFFFD